MEDLGAVGHFHVTAVCKLGLADTAGIQEARTCTEFAKSVLCVETSLLRKAPCTEATAPSCWYGSDSEQGKYISQLTLPKSPKKTNIV